MTSGGHVRGNSCATESDATIGRPANAGSSGGAGGAGANPRPCGVASPFEPGARKSARRQIAAEQDRPDRQHAADDEDRDRALALARVGADADKGGGVQDEERRRRFDEFPAVRVRAERRERHAPGAHQ